MEEKGARTGLLVTEGFRGIYEVMEQTRGYGQATYDLYLKPPSAPSLAPSQEGIATILELLVESGRLPSPAPPAEKYIDERYFGKLD